ncbi:MAG: DNA repair exonuclease [Gemmataceae bacterium]|nr:DNA repair exonuclease [Gemmataceae bacterium]
MFKFLHAADLHLDSPLRGLNRYEGAPVEAIRGATRRALENLVELAIRDSVRFVLIAGDVYDGDWEDVNTGLFFVRQMARLKDKRIPVYLISGNHDAASEIARDLPYPDNVHVFPYEAASTKILDDFRVAIHGQSYARRDDKRNLANQYPLAIPGHFNVAMLHTALEGRDGHENYAPCTLEELVNRGYDYWALGHVHQREAVNGGRWPRVEFAGNIQGRHIRELDAKGCLIVRVGEDRVARPEFHPLDVFRWTKLKVDCTHLEDREAILRRVAEEFDSAVQQSENRPLAVRVELSGVTTLHDELLADAEGFTSAVRGRAFEHGDRLWLEKIGIYTSRPLLDQPDDTLGEDALSEMEAVITDWRADRTKLAAVLAEGDVAALAGKLPAELLRGDNALPLATGDAAWLDRVQAILFHAATQKEVRS